MVQEAPIWRIKVHEPLIFKEISGSMFLGQLEKAFFQALSPDHYRKNGKAGTNYYFSKNVRAPER